MFQFSKALTWHSGDLALVSLIDSKLQEKRKNHTTRPDILYDFHSNFETFVCELICYNAVTMYVLKVSQVFPKVNV